MTGNLATRGYQVRPIAGDVIEGLGGDGQFMTPGERVVHFHASIARCAAGRFITAEGRVLAVTAAADSLAKARRRAYDCRLRGSKPLRVKATEIGGEGKLPMVQRETDCPSVILRRVTGLLRNCTISFGRGSPFPKNRTLCICGLKLTASEL